MQFIKPDINIDFIGKRKIAYSVSLALIACTILLLIIHNGPKYGIDFAGGTLIQVKFSGPVKLQDIQSGLAGMNLGSASVQLFGDKEDNEYLIRTETPDVDFDKHTQTLAAALTTVTGAESEIRRAEMVGPQVGKDLREKASFAIFYSLLIIAIYISGRFETRWIASGVMAGVLISSVYFLSLFNVSILILIVAALIVSFILFWLLKLKYAMGAIVALVHDVTITVGVFSLLGKEFSLPIIAALLTIIGYSLNDTIIVFDRIRENIKTYNKSPFDHIINRSVNETLSRTILTAGTTLVALLALYIWGGGIIHDFALAMIIGVVVGTYSSVYVASPILLAWERKGKK